MSKYQFEIIKEDEPTIIPEEIPPSQEGTFEERILLPSRYWILRSQIQGNQRDTFQFEDGTGEEEAQRSILAPDSQEASISGEEPVPQDQQYVDGDNSSSS